MAKTSHKSTTIKSVILAVFFVALVLFYFNYLSNKSSTRCNTTQKEELQKLLEYDMTLDYPNTPRDVAKLHNRYFKLFYGQSLSDEVLEKLNEKVRNLYCSELLAINPKDESLQRLKADIKDMKEKSLKYKLCELPEASQVETFTKDGKEMASLEVQITLNSSDEMGYFYQQYIMVKENGLWKIYGWGESTKAKQ
ncbi:MAG: DUF6715 family protein [Wujia sp.]